MFVPNIALIGSTQRNEKTNILHFILLIFFRLTKGRTKARQRKMHQIAQLLELPGNVGASCPSPPSINLHSLRKEAAAQSELFPAPFKKKKSPFSPDCLFAESLFRGFTFRRFFRVGLLSPTKFHMSEDSQQLQM